MSECHTPLLLPLSPQVAPLLAHLCFGGTDEKTMRIDAMSPLGVRLRTSTHMRPSSRSRRRHSESGCRSPTAVSVMTKSSPSAKARRTIGWSPSPSALCTAGPPMGNTSSEVPRTSRETMRNLRPSHVSTWTCPAVITAARCTALKPIDLRKASMLCRSSAVCACARMHAQLV